MSIKVKTVYYYELNDIMNEMERKGFMSKREFWRDYVCEWGVSNDTIFKLGFGYYEYTDKEEKYKVYFAEVNKMLGLPENNSNIVVHVSW